jgi:biopolymer transport protein ExbD
MAITFNKSRNSEDALMADINTTPLVDVMLVLLIIFLITIPAVTTSIAIKLPKETLVKSEPKLETIVISVDATGASFWKNDKLAGQADLQNRLRAIQALPVKPEVHIRGDSSASYETIGQTVYTLQQAGVTRIGFITQPPARN